jgi:hypothetical protein
MQKGRLARARRSHDRDELARCRLKAYAVDGTDLDIPLAKYPAQILAADGRWPAARRLVLPGD